MVNSAVVWALPRESETLISKGSDVETGVRVFHGIVTSSSTINVHAFYPTPPTGLISSNKDFITTLPDSNFILLKPIPVHLTLSDWGDWIARFEAANIGMSGSDPEDAKESLAYNILDTMDLFIEEEEELIPKLKRDFDVLRQYIKVRD